jgi:hypothetical protein
VAALLIRVAPFVVLVTSGCAKLLGVEGYAVGSGPAVTNPCGKNEVPGAHGACDPVGVVACPNFFHSESGACQPILPAEPCTSEGKEELGKVSCLSLDGALFCGRPQMPMGMVPGSATVYVDAAAAPGSSDGSAAHPWTTIQEALQRVPAQGAVLVGEGDYAEDLLIDKPGVQLVGRCAGKVRVIGSGAAAPPGYPCGYSGSLAAICVSSKATGSAIDALSVTTRPRVGGGGAADGIAIVGATGVRLGAVYVKQTTRYGVRIEELGAAVAGGSPTPASVSIGPVSIRDAHGAGLYVAGATIDTNPAFGGGLTVAGVLPLNGYLGYGVSILAGGTGISNPTPSSATLTSAVLIGNSDAALHVAGSTVTVDSSYLGNLPGAPPAGRGVLVERELPRGTEAALTLTRTTIQGVRDAGIEVRSARLTLDNVTIRDTAGLTPDGCSGQGVRVRSDPITPAAVSVKHSLIEGSRQAAIHALGATVTVEDSILRGSAPGTAAKACAPHLGDGITLESLPGAPSALTVNHSRIDGNARAAIASFGGTVSARNTVLSCNGRGLVDPARSPGERSGLLCGCAADWHACEAEADAGSLEPWMSPGAGSGHAGVTTDWHYTVQTYPGPTLLNHGVAWLLDAPEVAPGAADLQTACAPLLGVPTLPTRRVAVWAAGNAPGMWQVPAGTVPTGSECDSPIVSTGLLAYFPLTNYGEPIDFNRGIVAISGSDPTRLRQGPQSGAPWVEVVGLMMRVNVDPGWTDFTLGGVVCTGVVAPGSGDAVADQPSTRRVLLEPGMINNVTFTDCFTPGPCGPGKFEDATGACLTGAAAQQACRAAVASLPAGPGVDQASCAACECQNGLEAWSQCTHQPECLKFAACVTQTGCYPSISCPSPCALSFSSAVGAGAAVGPLAAAMDACAACAPPR